jgi:hypothetical protein
MRIALRLVPIVVVLGMLMSGCASTIQRSDSQAQSSSGGSWGKWFGKGKDDSAFYHDFEDVLIPPGMKVLPKQSMLFETPRVKTGVMVYEGRVDPVSLFDFFMTNMPKDNWSVRSYFKYNRYILVFEKPDRDCIITLVDNALNTQLEIWVAPRLGSPAQGARTFGAVGGGTPAAGPSTLGYPLAPGGQVLSD